MRKADAVAALAAVESLSKGVYTVDGVYVLTDHVDPDFAQEVLRLLGDEVGSTRHAHAVMSGLGHLQYGSSGSALTLCRRARHGTFPVTVVKPKERG